MALKPTKKQNELAASLHRISRAAALAHNIVTSAHIRNGLLPLGLGKDAKKVLAASMDELHSEINAIYEKYDEGEYPFA